MGWIDVNERLPEKEEPCWYYFDVVGTHRGFYGGLYEDEDGNQTTTREARDPKTVLKEFQKALKFLI